MQLFKLTKLTGWQPREAILTEIQVVKAAGQFCQHAGLHHQLTTSAAAADGGSMYYKALEATKTGKRTLRQAVQSTALNHQLFQLVQAGQTARLDMAGGCVGIAVAKNAEAARAHCRNDAEIGPLQAGVD